MCIRDRVISLSEIMRYSISKDSGRDMVPAETDLTILGHYFSIQQARFGDKLRWEMDIAPEVRECRIPKMMLQPLVENSINHGMRSSGEPLVIGVRGLIQHGMLIFLSTSSFQSLL